MTDPPGSGRHGCRRTTAGGAGPVRTARGTRRRRPAPARPTSYPGRRVVGTSSANGVVSRVRPASTSRSTAAFRAGDAAADPTAVEQTVGGRLAHEHRAEPVLRVGLAAPATHDVGLAASVGELQPVLAALAGPVAAGEALADDPLEPLLAASRRRASARRRTPAGSASGRRAGRARSAASRRTLSGSSIRSRSPRRRTSKTSRVTGSRSASARARSARRDVHPLGQRGEARRAVGEGDHLAVEQGVADRDARRSSGKETVASFSLRLHSRASPRRTSTRTRMPSHFTSCCHSSPVGTWVPRVASIGRMTGILPARSRQPAGRPAAVTTRRTRAFGGYVVDTGPRRRLHGGMRCVRSGRARCRSGSSACR